MIASVTGRLAAKAADRVVIATPGGVGYEVTVPLGVMERLPPAGQTVTLATELVVREEQEASTAVGILVAYKVTYNYRNSLGYGCMQRPDGGLTAFGASVISTMNDCGMAVDVSHCSERTTLDAIDASRKPVLITHSNCRSLCPHPRCKGDEALRRMARRGGVMGITNVNSFVSRKAPATIENLLDHFDHVARVAGIEHVGIGSDFDGISTTPVGLEDVSTFTALFTELARRGWNVHRSRMLMFGFCAALCSSGLIVAFLPMGTPLLIMLLVIAFGSLGHSRGASRLFG